MAEADRFMFTFKEIAAALVKAQNLDEGTWGVYVEFGLAAANIPGPDEGTLVPAAIIPVVKLGLQRFEQASNLTVDASEINPRPKTHSEGRKRRIGPAKTAGTVGVTSSHTP